MDWREADRRGLPWCAVCDRTSGDFFQVLDDVSGMRTVCAEHVGERPAFPIRHAQDNPQTTEPKEPDGRQEAARRDG